MSIEDDARWTWTPPEETDARPELVLPHAQRAATLRTHVKGFEKPQTIDVQRYSRAAHTGFVDRCFSANRAAQAMSATLMPRIFPDT